MRFAVVALTVSFLVCPRALPQSPAENPFRRAPAGVEEALRDRVNEFYSLLRAGKFRQAEDYVCQESRDVYYGLNKKRWPSWEILRVNFGEDFQTAKVVLSVTGEVRRRNVVAEANMPVSLEWRLEEGQWRVHLPPPKTSEMETPFGIMTGGGAAGLAGGAPGVETAPGQIVRSVEVTGSPVTFRKDAAGKGEVAIHNGLPGGVSVEVRGPNLPGLTWQLSSADVNSGQTARLVIQYQPKGGAVPPSTKLDLTIEPLGVRREVAIVFTQR